MFEGSRLGQGIACQLACLGREYCDEEQFLAVPTDFTLLGQWHFGDGRQLPSFFYYSVQLVLPAIVCRTNEPGFRVVTGTAGLNVPRAVPPGYCTIITPEPPAPPPATTI